MESREFTHILKSKSKMDFFLSALQTSHVLIGQPVHKILLYWKETTVKKN